VSVTGVRFCYLETGEVYSRWNAFSQCYRSANSFSVLTMGHAGAFLKSGKQRNRGRKKAFRETWNTTCLNLIALCALAHYCVPGEPGEVSHDKDNHSRKLTVLA
jgi:hypothetical protein